MIEFLKAAAQAAERTQSEALPSGAVRFLIEYEEAADLPRERARLEKVFGGSQFDLFPYSTEDDPNLLILQFQGVKLEQSSAFLFRVSDELAEALGAVSVTPEIMPAWFDADGVADQQESVGDIVSSRCRSKAAPPQDPQWARKMIRADAANADFSTGKNALIGQPDTGVADHAELQAGLNKARGYNFVDDTPDPTDPVSASMSSPGHGTATSSVVISRTSGVVTGSAPGATLVPIRCVDGVIIGTGVAVAKAIDHARRQGCHIVTMSLGGPLKSRTLAKAIQRAVDANMIVMSAAGNCVGFVVYPARDKNVIALAGVDENKIRWRGSSHGRKVDISAPGENVHVARRSVGSADTTIIDKEGQGTSYAVALTAGCAALWIDHHGFNAIKAEAARRGTNVQELFRTSLKETAQTPAGWDTSDMGAGIVDAHKLLSLPLNDIPDVTPAQVENPLASLFADTEANISDSKLESIISHPSYQQFEAQASFLASDRMLRSDISSTILENAVPPRPSEGFIRLLQETEAAGLFKPNIATGPLTPTEMPTELASRIGRTAGGAFLESAGNVRSVLEQAESVINYRNEKRAGGARIKKDILGDFERSITEFAQPAARGNTRALIAQFDLEALIQMVGRPALRMTDGDLPFDVEDPAIGQWAADLIPLRSEIGQMARSVGRIDILTDEGWTHVGTGYVYENGVIMTNRHVLDAFAEPFPIAPGRSGLRLVSKVSINFDPNASDDRQRFAIKSIVSSGAHRIGRFVDLNKLDMALLEIETNNGHQDQPQPIGPATATTSNANYNQILLIGYPAEPGHGAAPDGTQAMLAYWDRIREIYNGDFSTKYLSPGLIKTRPDRFSDGDKEWAFSHDLTTMAGCSGSPMAVLGQNIELCGLHFGGRTFSQNLAHDLKAVDFANDLVVPGSQ